MADKTGAFPVSERFIPLIYLPGPRPLDAVICADELAHYYTAQQIVAKANEHAAQVSADLEQRIATARDEIQAIREHARQAGMDDAEHALQRLREQTIADTVDWLIAEDQLERQIANGLDQWIRHLLTQATAAWLDERNGIDDLMRRVKQRLESMDDRELASLYVAPCVDAAVREALAAMPRVRIHTDATLSAGQARLESRLALIHLDLDAHRDLILQRLSHS